MYTSMETSLKGAEYFLDSFRERSVEHNANPVTFLIISFQGNGLGEGGALSHGLPGHQI